MTLQQVCLAKATEKAAQVAFWAQHAVEAKTGYKPSVKYKKLQGAMISATLFRQAAMTAYIAAFYA